MAVVSLKHLFEAGAHLGHKTQKWHPKMKGYIFGAQSGIYIIDLRQTLQKLKKAYEHVVKLSADGGKILFVGTKFQARDIIREEAERSNSFFVNFRWLGGMLTNFSTIKQSITKLKNVEDIAGADGDYVGILKKEAVRMEKQRRKLENVLGGIVELRKKPAAVFIVDIRREFIALNEAKKLGIPVIAIVDTNCDPRDIDYVIPGNDDSIHCIKLFSSIIASAAIEGRKRYETKTREVIEAPKSKENENILVEDAKTIDSSANETNIPQSQNENLSTADSEPEAELIEQESAKTADPLNSSVSESESPDAEAVTEEPTPET